MGLRFGYDRIAGPLFFQLRQNQLLTSSGK
nr:MAG TPA: hypothetical protein [Caudoviricetes sp.]